MLHRFILGVKVILLICRCRHKNNPRDQYRNGQICRFEQTKRYNTVFRTAFMQKLWN